MSSSDSSVVYAEECPRRPSELASVLCRLQGLISGTTYQRLVSAIDDVSSDAYQRGVADGVKRSVEGRSS